MTHSPVLKILFAAGLSLVALPAAAQTLAGCNDADPSQVRLEVSVSGMRNTTGEVSVTIYPDDAEHFLDGKYKVTRQSIPVAQPVTRFCFVLPAAGYYAVALYHDENVNHHFDTTAFGIPAEGYGFSNDPALFVGPPKLKQVRIPVHAGANKVAVKLKYYF